MCCIQAAEMLFCYKNLLKGQQEDAFLSQIRNAAQEHAVEGTSVTVEMQLCS